MAKYSFSFPRKLLQDDWLQLGGRRQKKRKEKKRKEKNKRREIKTRQKVYIFYSYVGPHTDYNKENTFVLFQCGMAENKPLKE